MSKKNFEGTRTYKLCELFSGEHRAIVIPDLQRDYCWGDSVHTSEHKDLVRDFIRNLVELYDKAQNDSEACSRDEDFNLGLIYGFEQPSDQVQLCDGQQRVTTLYLLVGMLNRYLGDDSLKHYLISKYEEDDDKEPYLRYSIRESSLYFMSDLVCRFFTRGTCKKWPLSIEGIRESDWYYNDYDRDPSIQSMLRAISIIEKTMASMEVDWRGFAEFIMKRLTFLYYDTETRENGEETFVVINTTGEPLSATQNLKPKIVSAKINVGVFDITDKWEEMETWFWIHRANGNDTSDVGFGEFLRWVALLYYCAEKPNDNVVSSILELGSYTFPVDEIPFTSIYSLFNALKSIYEKHTGADLALTDKNYLSEKNGQLALIDLYKFLPVVRYVERFINVNDIDIRRVFRYFANLALYRNKEITKENKSLTQAVRLVDSMPSKDVVAFLKCKNVSKHILPDEERRKLQILSASADRRREIEEAFWEAQNFRMFGGEITPILDWATDVGIFSFEKFKSYAETIKSRVETSDEKDLDLIRRALLAYNLEGYPVRDGKNLSFCGEDWQWKKIVSINSSSIQAFLNDLINSVDVNLIIKRCRKSSKWYEIARYPCVLAYCEHKNIQDDVAEGLILIKRQRATKWFRLSLIKETRDRFGADDIIGFERGGCHEIGFSKIINGHVRYLQRWLLPREGQADLYLMKDDGPYSYVEVKGAKGDEDLKRYRCMRVTECMQTDEIIRGVEALISKCPELDMVI